MRPTTLAEVARLTERGESFDLCLADFLDNFKATLSEAALSPVPDLLEPRLGERGRVQDAYLGATAEHLAQANNFGIPGWAMTEARRLRRPWFASQLAALRAVLILESPVAFRSRNLFVSENALNRA